MSSIKFCENCGKEISIVFGSGRFCSKSCANKRTFTQEQKDKVSAAVKRAYDKIERDGKTCEKCGQVFHSRDMSRKLCSNCLPTTIKHTKGKEDPKSILDVSKRTTMKILKRMDLPCSCCGFYVKGVSLDLHHITPRKNGGTNDMSNLTYICPNCHRIAHTDIKLLNKPLISILQQLENFGKDWKDFYYG